MNNDVMIVRIYLWETEHGRHGTLMQEVLDILRNRQRVRGVVVFRAIAGLNDSGEVHAADLLRLNVDLPLVVEFFDEPDIAEAAIGLLQDIVPAGHILHWRAVQHQSKPAG